MATTQAVSSLARFLYVFLPALMPTRVDEGSRDARRTISGRIADPQGLLPDGAALIISRQDEPSFSSRPVPIAPDRSFAVSNLDNGVYVLELKVRQDAPSLGENVIGF